MFSLYVLCLVIFFNSRSAISYPYEPTYQSDYAADHAAIVAEVDSQVQSKPYSDAEFDDYVKNAGGSYDDRYFSSAGGKGDKGYSTYDNYDKGRVGHYGVDGQKNQYSDKGGHKNGHVDNSNYYNNNHALKKSSQGSDFAVSNSFNKGSKTSGFHNVHHKEEYQKNNKFYDENNKNGYYRRYGDFGAALLAASGGGASGKRYDEGYRDANYGKRGFADKGSLYDDLKHYAAANGYDGYYGNYGDFGHAGGDYYGQGHGYNH